MASGCTEHYGLSLWKAGDQFLREEFNGDHRALDAALRRAEEETRRVRERLTPLSWDLYNLILGRDYEGRVTEWKRALIFDGFTGAERVERRGPGLLLDRETATLWLTALGEESFTHGGIGSQTHVTSTVGGRIPWRPTGSGRLTGITLYFTGALTAELVDSESGLVLAGGTFAGLGSAGVFCPMEVEIGAGGDYLFRFSKPDDSDATFYYGKNPNGADTWLPFTRHVTPAPITRGELTGHPADLGTSGHNRALGWVRYTGGSVSLALDDGAGWRAAEPAGERDTVEPGGAACRERTFRLEGLTGSTLRARLTLEGQTGCRVYDYGVVVV